MNQRVQQLLAFHGVRNFGSRETLIARQREARAICAELTSGEQGELAETAINQVDHENSRTQNILCCLACFQPGSLAPFHQRLVQRRILYPGLIFHGAESGIADELLTFVKDDDRRNFALLALAWVGDETVRSAFAQWREQPPSWAASLHAPPDRYLHEAGWELTEGGMRRDLFAETAFPLTPPTAESRDGSVRTGVESEVACP